MYWPSKTRQLHLYIMATTTGGTSARRPRPTRGGGRRSRRRVTRGVEHEKMTEVEMVEEQGGMTELLRVHFQGYTAMVYLVLYYDIARIGTNLIMSYPFPARPAHLFVIDNHDDNNQTEHEYGLTNIPSHLF